MMTALSWQRALSSASAVLHSGLRGGSRRRPSAWIAPDKRLARLNTSQTRAQSSTSPVSDPETGKIASCFALSELGGARYLSINSLKDNTVGLDLVFLRDTCSCSQCVNAHSGQKEFETADIPLNIDIEAAELLGDGNVQIAWKNDITGYQAHCSVYPTQIWLQNSTRSARLSCAYEGRVDTPWNKASLSSKESEIRVDFDRYMQSEATLFKLLHSLNAYGLAFIQNVPDDQESVKRMANRIGPLMNTFYGETWDVRVQPSATNVANTSSFLGFHMDLLYMRDPPYLQFLHFIRQSTQGGESLFSDTLNAVYHIQESRPDLAPAMWRFPVTYRYKNGGKYYQFRRPMLEGQGMIDADRSYAETLSGSGDRSGQSEANAKPGLLWGRHFDVVNWSPPFQGPLLWDIGGVDADREAIATSASNSTRQQSQPEQNSLLRDYVQMARLFRQTVENPVNVYETKMEEGTCVVFDNRRIVHARRAFNTQSGGGGGGERWLKGAYVDGNSFSSRLRAFQAGMSE